jgi:hypothetical protein
VGENGISFVIFSWSGRGVVLDGFVFLEGEWLLGVRIGVN